MSATIDCAHHWPFREYTPCAKWEVAARIGQLATCNDVRGHRKPPLGLFGVTASGGSEGCVRQATISGPTAAHRRHVPVRARLPVQPAPAPGSYQDSIIATLSYPGNKVSTPFEVTANEAPTCTVSATDLVFGGYTLAQLDGQSAIDLTCTHTTPWAVGLSQGVFPGATVTTRKMTGPGGASLPYALFQDAARAVNWGNTVGVDTVRGTGTKTTSRPSMSMAGRRLRKLLAAAAPPRRDHSHAHFLKRR